MMKLFNISDVAGLTQAFDSCESDVCITTCDGNIFSWDHERRVVRSMFDSMVSPNISQIDVRCTSGADIGRIMQFMFSIC